MGLLSDNQIADLESDLASILTQISVLESSISSADAAGKAGWKLDTGVGSQSVQYQSTTSMLKSLDILRRKRDHIRTKLRGLSVMKVVVRR